MNSLDEALTDLGAAILTFTNQVRPAVEQLGRALELAEELRAAIDVENNEPAKVVQVRPEPEPAPRPQIGDTKPAPPSSDLKTVTKRLQGGKVNWEEQIKFLFDGHTCDRIVREVVNEQAAKQQKYFIQNKDRRVRVDVVTTDGVTQIEVRRRGPGE